MKVETISVSSRRSSNIKGEYFTFESSMTVSLEDGESVKDCYKKAWDTVNLEVDNQMQDCVS